MLATFDGRLAERFAELARIARAAAPVVLLGDSGTGKEVVARALHELSRRDGDFVAVTDEPVIKAAIARAPMVIVGGGDGTLSSVVDHFVGKDTVFAVLPIGTANSFARTLGVPLDMDGATDVIAYGRRKRIDLGIIDGDYFANAAALGLSPLIADTVPAGLKRYLGIFGYLIGQDSESVNHDLLDAALAGVRPELTYVLDPDERSAIVDVLPNLKTIAAKQTRSSMYAAR